MRITKDMLDKRICDVEGGDYKATYRKFIEMSEDEFGFVNKDLDEMTEEQLNGHLDFLDDLWGK